MENKAAEGFVFILQDTVVLVTGEKMESSELFARSYNLINGRMYKTVAQAMSMLYFTPLFQVTSMVCL